MNDWVYDLQRFAEGDTAESTAADTPAAPAGQDASADTATGQGTPPAVEQPSAGSFGVVVDPVTGARSLVPIHAAQDAETLAPEGEPAQEGQPETPAAPAAYTANELLAALTTGRVDESRIPEELRANYVAIRQQQQIAALTAQQQMAAAQPQPPQESPPPPQGTDLYRRIQSAAEEKALKDLGITREQLSELSYAESDEDAKKAAEYRVAVQMNVNAIAREIDAYQTTLAQQRAETEAFAAAFVPKMQQVQASEPNFNQIDVMMETYYQQMPYQEAVQVAELIERYKQGLCTRADIPLIESYYNKTRAAFYAKKTGLSAAPTPAPKPTPPTVEGAGKVAPSAPEPVDWRAMRTMSARERSAFLRAHMPY